MKIKKFNILLKWLNINKISNINNQPLNSNSWLAGFIDADGSFDIRIKKDKYPEIRFRLEQTLIGYESLFTSISKEFD
jgi:hypothetical protein